ncbi:MAG: hypothetical protein ABMA02_03620 [Saprospiraceae bacterium]
MQDIRELALFVATNNPQLAKGGGQKLGLDTKAGTLFQALVKNKVETDEDALMLLYGSKDENSSYRKIKSGLRDKMLESLLDLDLSSGAFTDYQQAYYACHKQWLYVKILTGQNVNVAAMALAKRLLKQTIKYDFVQLSMDISSYLRIQYALREGDDKRFVEMNQQFVFYRDVYDAESVAEELYSVLVARYINSRAPKDKASEAIEENYARLVPLLERFDSYRLHLYGRLIGLMQFTTTYNFEQALAFSDDAIRFFQSKPYEARVPVQIFLYEKLICHVQLRQFEEGKKAAEQCASYLKSGTFNWFKYQELSLKLAMHTQQYQDAYNGIEVVLAHPRYQFLPENVKEIWRIYEAYLYFLLLLGKVKPTDGHSFKSGKFFNEVPIFSKDKSGLNIAIQVIRFLLLIAERKQAQLYDETDSWNQYCYRYINTPQTQRSFNFFKALLHIPAGRFDWAEVEKKAKRNIEQMKQLPLRVADQIDEIEIIPYEDLWSLVQDLLSRR